MDTTHPRFPFPMRSGTRETRHCLRPLSPSSPVRHSTGVLWPLKKDNSDAFHILYPNIDLIGHLHLKVTPTTSALKSLAFMPHDVKEMGFLGYVLHTCLIIEFVDPGDQSGQICGSLRERRENDVTHL